MSEIKLSNQRTMIDTVIVGANVTLTGRATMDASGKVLTAEGDIRKVSSDSDIYVGNYTLYGININDAGYINHRTEASQLLDELTAAINDGTISVEGGEA